jgi:protein SCO1/2
MKNSIANTVISCVVFMALVLGLTLNRILSPVNMSNEELSENGLFVYDVPRLINQFSLQDFNGKAVDLDLLQGKWSMIFFGYTFCPDICPLTMATLNQFTNMLAEQGEYSEDTQVIMVSVDPQRDTLEKLREYVSYFNDDYLGLSGEYIDIFNFSSQLNIAFAYVPGAGDNYMVNHSGEIALINPNGHFHGFFKVPHDPEKMAINYEVVRQRWQ